MLQSMTGYGKEEFSINGKKISVEIKSLNSKNLDVSVRMPSFYREKELSYRNIITKELSRGKIELNIFVEKNNVDRPKTINKELAKKYHIELLELSELLNENGSHLLSHVLKMPEVIQTEAEEISNEEWKALEQAINTTIGQFKNFRAQEGKALEKELLSRVDNIEQLLAKVEPFENERIEKVKERIKNNIDKAVDESNIDKNRFEQELIYYLEKFDVTEEKVRLKNHCKYFAETVKNDTVQGKKLGFISQEIGREINTLGSKANHEIIQKLVVEMKDELEKIKEQTLNVL